MIIIDLYECLLLWLMPNLILYYLWNVNINSIIVTTSERLADHVEKIVNLNDWMVDESNNI